MKFKALRNLTLGICFSVLALTVFVNVNTVKTTSNTPAVVVIHPMEDMPFD